MSIKDWFKKKKNDDEISGGYTPDSVDVDGDVDAHVDYDGDKTDKDVGDFDDDDTDDKLENNDVATDLRAKKKRIAVMVAVAVVVVFALLSRNGGKPQDLETVAEKQGVDKAAPAAPKPKGKVVDLPPSLNVRGIIDATAKQEIHRRDIEHKKDIDELVKKQEQRMAELEKKLLEKLSSAKQNGDRDGAKNDVAMPPSASTRPVAPNYYPPSPNGAAVGSSAPGYYPDPNVPVPPSYGVSYEIIEAVPFEFEDETPVAAASSGEHTGGEPSFVQAYNDYGSNGDEGDYLTSGSFVRGTIIQGADVPAPLTGEGEKFPILIHLTQDSFGPNYVRRPVKECFVIASGQGDISAEKAYFRTESISCEFDDGTTMDSTDIKGYVADIDGKAGVRGPVIWRNGAQIALSLASGFLSGFGEATSAASLATNTALTGAGVIAQQPPSFSAIVQGGAFAGIGKTAEKMSKRFDEYADAIFPLIQIGALREVDIVLLKGLWLTPNVHNEKGGK